MLLASASHETLHGMSQEYIARQATTCRHIASDASQMNAL